MPSPDRRAGSVRASAIEAASPGQPGVRAAKPSDSNSQRQSRQHAGVSHSPCTNSTGTRPLALAASTAARSDPSSGIPTVPPNLFSA